MTAKIAKTASIFLLREEKYYSLKRKSFLLSQRRIFAEKRGEVTGVKARRVTIPSSLFLPLSSPQNKQRPQPLKKGNNMSDFSIYKKVAADGTKPHFGGYRNFLVIINKKDRFHLCTFDGVSKENNDALKLMSKHPDLYAEVLHACEVNS